MRYLAFVSVAVIAVACSGSDSENSVGQAEQTTPSDGPGSSASPTTQPSAPITGTTPPTLTTPTGPANPVPDAGTPSPDAGSAGTGCAAKGTSDTCYACCATDHPKGGAAFMKGQKNYAACACDFPGDCDYACAGSLCSGRKPASGSMCERCLAGLDNCDNKIRDAVRHESDYPAFAACAEDARCAEKP